MIHSRNGRFLQLLNEENLKLTRAHHFLLLLLLGSRQMYRKFLDGNCAFIKLKTETRSQENTSLQQQKPSSSAVSTRRELSCRYMCPHHCCCCSCRCRSQQPVLLRLPPMMSFRVLPTFEAAVSAAALICSLAGMIAAASSVRPAATLG